jgi:uncharacterized protein (DUF952 family)
MLPSGERAFSDYSRASAPVAPAMLIFHLAIDKEWAAAIEHGGAYDRSTRGRSLAEEGFIHCSFANQVDTIADLLYRGRDDVLLLTVDTSRLHSPVRIEKVDGTDQLFPHIYGPLPLAAVVRVAAIPLDPDGRLAVAALLD